MTDNYLQNLHWRYATQKFDLNKKLSDEQINYLLEAARLAPSSFGLQPWKLIVVTDPALREQLRAAGMGQPKISEASHLIVFCAQKDMRPQDIERYIQTVATTQGVAVETLDGLKNMLMSTTTKPQEQQLNWHKRQVYIALGFLLSAAAQAHIDAGPMEGFDAQKFDEILGLESTNYTTTVLCAVGFRDANDPAAKRTKVRYCQDEVIEWRR